MLFATRRCGLSQKDRSERMMRAWQFLFIVLFLFVASPVWAQSDDSNGSSTLGHIICNIKDNLRGYPYILNVVCFVAGAFMAVRAFFIFKKHGENPAQSQVVSGVAHLVGAGCLMALPSVAGVLQLSVMGSGSGAGSFGCLPVSPSNGTSLDGMLQNFVRNIHGPLSVLLSLIAVAAGLTFIASALFKAAKTGADPRAADPKSIITNLVFGSLLISIGTLGPSILKTIFGSGAVSSMTDIKLIQWSKLTGSSSANTDAADQAVQAVLAFVQIIGFISFVRGWLIMKKAVEGGGQATIPQGLAHIIGGAMAINIDVSLRAIDKTFGFNVMNSSS